MRLAYKFRLYPNRAQAEAMTRLLETHRRLYNDALAERKEAYEAEKRTVSFYDQSASLTINRATNPFLAEANASSCHQTLRRLDKAFAAFFRRVKAGEKPGYPRFRGRDRFDTVEFTYGNGCKLDGAKVYFQHVGPVKIKLHRRVEGRIKTASFKREAGRWYVIFSCECPDIAIEAADRPEVGIDLGLKSFLVTSDGESIAPSKVYREGQKKLRRLQRALCRKQKGGANRRKARQHVARQQQHVANQRRDWHHKIALSLIRRYGLVAHEELNVKGLARTRLARSVHDAGWSQFLAILAHKAEGAGVRVVAVDARNTTQTCSQCGALPALPLGLKDRVYRCESCGAARDRDENAAVNILLRARTGPLGANQGGCLTDCPRSRCR